MPLRIVTAIAMIETSASSKKQRERRCVLSVGLLLGGGAGFSIRCGCSSSS